MSDTTMRFLVIGGSGLLGQNLHFHLQKQGHEVLSLSPGSGHRDFTVLEQCQQAFAESKPDVVVNLAAYTNVDGCETDLDKAYRLNSKIVENLVTTLHNSSCHLIHISTDMMYNSPRPSKEDEIKILNVYALSKRAGEAVLQSSSLRYTILRTNFFGKSHTANRSSFSDWLLEKFQSNEEISLFDDVFFSPLHMSTLCSVIETCALRRTHGLFNAGTRDSLSKKDFALAVAALFNIQNLNYKVTHMADKKLTAQRPLYMAMNSEKIAKELEIKLPSIHDEIQKLREEST
ncbi:MAG: SDR family oxidoreductase [Bdellovibrio sp.]